jgi:hypothetical protein
MFTCITCTIISQVFHPLRVTGFRLLSLTSHGISISAFTVFDRFYPGKYVHRETSPHSSSWPWLGSDKRRPEGRHLGYPREGQPN